MKVLVFGGTHGNEWTGIAVVNHYAESFKKKYPTLDVEFILANPEAYKLNKRYKDEDLNRVFQFLHEKREESYEHRRAHEIKSLIEKQECFVIDLHTTTSNMGATVIAAHYNPLNLYLAKELSINFPECRIIGSPDPERKYLVGQSDFGLMIEVGPVANGLIDAFALERTLRVLDLLLGKLASNASPVGGELEVYEEIDDIYYPLNASGQRDAYIHPKLQGKDFTPFIGEYPCFRRFNGEEIFKTNKEELYPIFINEAAYYPQALAFTLCRRITLKF